LLGDLPIIGNLFRSRGRSRGRTNLMVFIRPTILRSAEDAREMSARRYDYARGQQLVSNPNASRRSTNWCAIISAPCRPPCRSSRSRPTPW
jgi:type II secretory pathway component GspD/PulD (secretin)